MGDVLVERDPFLAPLLEWVPDAATPSGRLVFLGGEAGVGKTSLVGLLTTRLGADVAVRRGFCDNVATPPPLGPVLDALPELAATIEETTPSTRPPLFREIRARLTERPTLLVLEDVHWADEATLELVVPRTSAGRYAAARRGDVPRRRGWRGSPGCRRRPVTSSERRPCSAPAPRWHCFARSPSSRPTRWTSA